MLKRKIRKLCKDAPAEKLKNLLSDARGSRADEPLPFMPSGSSLSCIGKRGLKRMRIAEETFPVEDQANANYISIINFCIPDKLLHHEDRGHNVLFLDSKTTDPLLERILVSGLPESFDLIWRACQIIADGIFFYVSITVYARIPISRNSRRLYSQLSPLSAARQKQSTLFAITRYASSQMSRTRTAHVYHRLRVGYDRRN